MSMIPLLVIATVQITPARVAVSPTPVELAVDSSIQLRMEAFDSTGRRLTGSVIRWISLTPEVVSVDAAGRAMALRPGEGEVTVVVDGRPGFATISVPQLPAATIALELPAGTVAAGTSAPLRVAVRTKLGDSLPATSIRFRSDAPDIVGVDATGRVFARREGRTVVRATGGEASAAVPVHVVANSMTDYRLEPGEEMTVRTGDVVRFQVGTPGSDRDLYPEWTVSAAGAQIEADEREGVFVAEEPGTYRVVALIGEAVTRTAIVHVVPRQYRAELRRVGRGPAATHHSGDTWVFAGVDGRDYAYIGTYMHDWMKVWDVTDPARPILTDSLQLDARRINDVKIHPNNRVGIVTREGASDRRNGLVILDLATPAHPTILSEYKETVTGGVHNVWIESNDLVYAAHNGTSEMHIIDIADPTQPREVGRWGLEKPAKTLHDIIVQDGYAYLSYWDDGVIMLDVGAGTHRGTPTSPAFVSQFAYPIGNTHVAWRGGRYLFIGDEIFPSDWNADAPVEARGYVHVVDYQDPEHPVEVARYEVPEAGAHNVWVEGDRLYVGYYQAGLRVVDISGELRGDLYRQGREIAALKPLDANTTVPNWPMTWGAQVYKGHIFTSDLNSGLWIMRLIEETIVP